MLTRISNRTIQLFFFTLSILLTFHFVLPSSLYAQSIDTNSGMNSTGQQASSNIQVDRFAALPKMSKKQIVKMSNPVEGMIIFNTSIEKPEYYEGKAWKILKENQHFIGEQFGGGIVFYTDASREHGMIAAAVDQHTHVIWGEEDKIAGANNNKLGAGSSNTEKIVKVNFKTENAAHVCSELELNGFSDWYLPSLEELNLMYQNLYLKGIGNFADLQYWTSSETDFNNAWFITFKNGDAIENHINKAYHVRAARNF